MKRVLFIGILSGLIITNQNICSKQHKRQCLEKHGIQQSKKLTKKISTSAITYNLNGGRFGDNLFSYCKTMWLADKYGISFLYKPFQYSKKLKLHKKGIKYTRRTPLKFKAVHYLTGSRFCKLQAEENILYIKKWYYDVQVDWKDAMFIKKLRKLIRPSVPLDNNIRPPKNCVTIAVHVRRGGGYRVDTKRLIDSQPLRFASDQFYIDQIKRLATMFEGKNLYVHIFTDDLNPQTIVENFKRRVNLDRISYGYRRSGNNPCSYVLEDFFAMMKFDCLIRPKSHYSRFVERLGNNKVIIAPIHVSKNKGGEVIDTIRIRQLTDIGWEIKKIKLL